MPTIHEEMDRIANIKTQEEKDYAKRQNEKPCAVCGKSEFVQKFRNVVGEISGSMFGHFSLFGGSVSGSIDGYTKTLPVLSCRNCGNEREIITYKYYYEGDIFWDFIDKFYFLIEKADETYKIDPFFLQRPVETRGYALKTKNYQYRFLNRITEWEPEVWAKAGFNISKIEKKYLWFFKVTRYPTWDELAANSF